jgi:hypothetical protein
VVGDWLTASQIGALEGGGGDMDRPVGYTVPPVPLGNLHMTTSFVYYLPLMGNAELAVGDGTNPNYSFPPVTQQDQANFLNLMGDIGTGIGNNAAHELAHQLIVPNMDCGNGVVVCDGSSNFVYQFYNASGYPPNVNNPATSQGGQFFYQNVPGVVLTWTPDGEAYLQHLYRQSPY